MTTNKLSISKLKPILTAHIFPALNTHFTMDEVLATTMTHLGVKDEREWGVQVYNGVEKCTWFRYNVRRATSNMALDGTVITRDGTKKNCYVKVGAETLVETPVVETPVVETVEEITPVVEETLTEETLEDMDSLLDDIFDDVKPVIEVGGGETFELPTPPEDTSGLDEHLVETLKEITGCYGYYSARATKCKECPLAHHCAKSLGDVMNEISKTLLA